MYDTVCQTAEATISFFAVSADLRYLLRSPENRIIFIRKADKSHRQYFKSVRSTFSGVSFQRGDGRCESGLTDLQKKEDAQEFMLENIGGCRCS